MVRDVALRDLRVHGTVHEVVAERFARADPYVVNGVVTSWRVRALGRQGWMRIFPEHASIESGGVYWGPGLARSRRGIPGTSAGSRSICTTGV